jgi:hypothetical protein
MLSFVMAQGFARAQRAWQAIFMTFSNPTFMLSLNYFSIALSVFNQYVSWSVNYIYIYIIFRNMASMFNDSCLCVPQKHH